jgi:hypothetical protein
MVDYREYGVVWAILWELCDEVHCYFFERICLRVWGDAVYRGVYLVCQVFVLLTGGTSFDVVFDPLIHAGPPVPSFRGLYGFISPWVSSGGCVVVVVHDSPPQVHLRWDHDLVTSEPPGVLHTFILGEVKVMNVPPPFYFLVLSSLSSRYFLL